MHFLTGLGGIAFDGDRIGRFRAAEEAVLRNGCAAQTGDRGDPGEQIELESGNRRALVSCRRGINSEENQVIARTRPSVSSCLIRRARPAPMAMRMANSLCRAAPRASRRFATLAQAMRRTNPTMAIKIFRGSPKCSRSMEEPFAAGCRLIR